MNSTDRTNLNTIVSAEGFLVGQADDPGRV